jgi:hypothetical protein
LTDAATSITVMFAIAAGLIVPKLVIDRLGEQRRPGPWPRSPAPLSTANRFDRSVHHRRSTWRGARSECGALEYTLRTRRAVYLSLAVAVGRPSAPSTGPAVLAGDVLTPLRSVRASVQSPWEAPATAFGGLA